MNIRLKLVIAGLCFLSGGNTCADERPNILFVLTEDQGAHLSLLGTPGLKTPHIDSLANSGVYFSNAFVTYPVCSASKAAMYTGLHGHTNGILNNTHNFHKPASRVTKAEQNLWLARNNRIRDPFLTLTEILKANGYYQGVTHKLHVLPNEKFPYDEFLHGSRSELENFITNATNRDQPWFLMVNLPNSHRPFPNSDKNPIRVRPSEVRLPRFLPDSSAVRRDWAEYLAGIEQADALTGRTLEVLERCGQQDNTIVFFMSDHGPAFQHGKMTLYDLGLRVPLIVSGPGIAQTLVRDELVSELDLLPTILQLCGIDPPFDYSLHGQSIERLLTSDTAAKGHEYLFAEISNRGPLPNDGIQERSVFDGRWKLIYRENVGKAWRQVNADSRQFETWGNRTYDETIRLRDECPEAFRILAEMDPQNLGAEVPEVEVYDLEFDPDEIRNLAAEPSAAPIRNRLIAALRSWAKETKDTSISLVSFQEDESHTVASPEVAAAEVATAEVAVQDFDELKKQLTRQWPNNRLVRFVFHGHSVPAGYFRGGKVRRFDSYPVLFHQQLCDAYPTSVIDVCTTAIGGEHSEGGARRFADDVLTMKPDVVFIDYCLNDRVIGVEAATQNWIEMIQQAQANNVKVVLLTPTPDSHENILDPNAKLAAHAAAVRKLGQRFGVPVVDSYQAFATLAAHGESVKDYLSQPNHPNRKGHQVVADLLLELFETTSKVIESPENGVHQKSRLIVMADMGNEPDEMQQMMHLLMYSNRVDLEGLIACSGKYLHADRTDGRTQVHPELFHHLVDGYEQVVDKLRLHAADWPGPEYLRSIIKGGSPAYGIQAVEVGRSNEASKLIEASILKDDPRDLYIVGNAGTNTLAQALVDLDRSRTEDEMRRLCSNIIVFENGAQDNSGAWIAAKYPGIRWHRSNHQTYAYGGPGGKNHTAQGPYTWEPFERSVIGQNQWAEQHVMMDHGELGARFPPRIMRERLHFIEGGGTIPWMGLVNHGLTDPGRLHWGGWSGRFSRTRHKNVYSRHSDIRKDEESYDDFQMYEADSEPESWTDPIHDDTFRGRYVPVWRFRRAMFNDFRGRMDWCVNGYEEANHNPVAAVNGDTTNEILRRKAKPGQSLTFDAAASSDPDGDELEFRWWIYDEAGTARKQIELSDNSGLSTTLTMPDDPPGSQIHLILTVRDQSEIVPMYDYRRVVISVEGEN